MQNIFENVQKCKKHWMYFKYIISTLYISIAYTSLTVLTPDTLQARYNAHDGSQAKRAL